MAEHTNCNEKERKICYGSEKGKFRKENAGCS